MKDDFSQPLMSTMQISISVILGLFMACGFGFLVFFGIVAAQRPEQPDMQVDLAVVLTGAQGRVATGFKQITEGRAKALFISGVHRDVDLKQLVALWDGSDADKQKLLKHCCIRLGHMAANTQDNASETALWLAAQKNVHSVRIITSDYHIPRAWMLFRRAMPDKRFYVWPVHAQSPEQTGFWRNMIIEYIKTIFTWAS